jgi:hypothetical protein
MTKDILQYTFIFIGAVFLFLFSFITRARMWKSFKLKCHVKMTLFNKNFCIEINHGGIGLTKQQFP